MSLSAPPTRGFQDFQRTGPWDSGVLFQDVFTSTAGQIVTPVLDVSRWAYLAGLDQLTLGQATVLFQWFADAAATHESGRRTFTMLSAGNPIAQYRVANLGPFLRISWTAIGVGNINHSAFLFGTNRYSPVEVIPQNRQMVLVVNRAVANLGSDVVNAGDYFSGPARVWVSAPAAGWVLATQTLDTANTWQLVEQWTLVSGQNILVAIVPLAGWRTQVTNASGVAGNYYLSVTPSTAGSS